MTTQTLKKYIGKHLQLARKAAGFKSAEAFANHMGISKNTYTGYEQGRISINIEQAWEFAEALGISIDELVGHEAERAYADPAQEALNGYYESMNDGARSVLVESARLMSDGDTVRIQKNADPVRVPPKVEEVA